MKNTNGMRNSMSRGLFAAIRAGRRLRSPAGRFLREQDGPTAVEYAVMLALIVIVCLSAVKTLGSNASAKFSTVGASLATGS